MNLKCCLALVGLIALSYCRAEACEFSPDAIKKVFGETTVTPDGVVRVAWPRKEVPVTINGVGMKPFMGLGTWAAFMKTEHGGMVMGDTVLFQDEVNAAIDAAFANNLEVTGLHNHFFYDEPKVYFMHIGGEGCPQKLAEGVKAVWDAVKEIRAKNASPAKSFGESAPQNSDLQPESITKILNGKVDAQDGMVKVTISRKASMHGMDVSGSMGLTTWAAFYGTDDSAVVDGDFAMTAAEVQPVLRSLRSSGVNIVALHNHMIGEHPNYFFVHFWSNGKPQELAKSIKDAIDEQAKAEPAKSEHTDK